MRGYNYPLMIFEVHKLVHLPNAQHVCLPVLHEIGTVLFSYVVASYIACKPGYMAT